MRYRAALRPDGEDGSQPSGGFQAGGRAVQHRAGGVARATLYSASASEAAPGRDEAQDGSERRLGAGRTVGTNDALAARRTDVDGPPVDGNAALNQSADGLWVEGVLHGMDPRLQ